MKKWTALLLIMAMLLLPACSSAPAETTPTTTAPETTAPTETTEAPIEPDVYPKNAELYFDTASIVAPPSEAYYKELDSENGLDGTVCAIRGIVTAYFPAEAEDADSVDIVRIHTEDGDVIVVSAINAMVSYIMDSFPDTDASFEGILRSYFPIPKVGDEVLFYAEYVGFSGAYRCGAFAYGGEDYAASVSVEALKEAGTTTTPSDTEIASNTTPVQETTASETEPKDEVTTGQRNALSTAKRYLRSMAFSYSGLIDQLEYEGYSNSEAVYAVDNCNADWNEQALKSAKNYLKVSAFSYGGLIDQLEYEGFTADQATYGADNCGADWNEQAAKSAKNYLDIMEFSRSGLIDQLEYEGFTYDQAVYGVEANGL